MKALWLVASLLMFAGCRTSTPPPEPAVVAQASERPAPKPRAACRTDAECPAGQVCGLCGNRPGECISGCRSDADCGEGGQCQQVQCIRCPCPNHCAPKLGR